MEGWTKRARRWATGAVGIVAVIAAGTTLLWVHSLRKDTGARVESVASSTQSAASAPAPATVEPELAVRERIGAAKGATAGVLGAFGEGRRPAQPPQQKQQPSILSEVDAIRAALEKASIAFNVPTPIKYDTIVEVRLRLSVRKSTQQLMQEVEGHGLREGAEVRVSRRVRAELTGPGFEIRPTSPLEQAVPTDDDVQWQWDVKAITRDPRTVLHLSLSSLALVDGAATPAWHRTFDRWIEIEVTPQQRLEQFVGQNWQWLWAAILVPLAGWWWRVLRSSKVRATAGDAKTDEHMNHPA